MIDVQKLASWGSALPAAAVLPPSLFRKSKSLRGGRDGGDAAAEMAAAERAAAEQAEAPYLAPALTSPVRPSVGRPHHATLVARTRRVDVRPAA